MNYVKVIFTLVPNIPEAAEIFILQLRESGYESFLMSETGFEACIPENLNDLYSPFPGIKTDFNHEVIPDKNRNRTWEENYCHVIDIMTL